GHVLAAVERDNYAATRHQIYKALECRLHCIQISVNIGVIELHVRQDQRIREVMQKFRPLVEKRCVVLIAFHDKGARGLELKARSKILGRAEILRAAAPPST